MTRTMAVFVAIVLITVGVVVSVDSTVAVAVSVRCVVEPATGFALPPAPRPIPTNNAISPTAVAMNQAVFHHGRLSG